MNNVGEPVKSLAVGVLLISIFLGAAAGQNKTGLAPGGTVYSDVDLSFRYKVPSGMRDETESARAAIQTQAISRPKIKTLDTLLKMSSGPDDAVPGWYSLSIEKYPRQSLGSLDDASAKAKMTAWVIGLASLPTEPKSVILSGQTFAVSVLARGDERGKKAAVIWTTIRKGKLLSFAFVADSPEQLTKLTESMKTVDFF